MPMARQVGAEQRNSFSRAVAAGAKVVLGTDASIYPHGLNARQLSRMVQFGMTSMQALKAATSLNAQLFDRPDVGAIQAGRMADIIAVTGDPLRDICLLEEVEFVMKGGVVYKR
jgi:imidazolonepropionase-like amidohydrolase